jgi:hypothetical protein
MGLVKIIFPFRRQITFTVLVRRKTNQPTKQTNIEKHEEVALKDYRRLITSVDVF